MGSAATGQKRKAQAKNLKLDTKSLDLSGSLFYYWASNFVVRLFMAE